MVLNAPDSSHTIIATSPSAQQSCFPARQFHRSNWGPYMLGWASAYFFVAGEREADSDTGRNGCIQQADPVNIFPIIMQFAQTRPLSLNLDVTRRSQIASGSNTQEHSHSPLCLGNCSLFTASALTTASLRLPELSPRRQAHTNPHLHSSDPTFPLWHSQSSLWRTPDPRPQSFQAAAIQL